MVRHEERELGYLVIMYGVMRLLGSKGPTARLVRDDHERNCLLHFLLREDSVKTLRYGRLQTKACTLATLGRVRSWVKRAKNE